MQRNKHAYERTLCCGISISNVWNEARRGDIPMLGTVDPTLICDMEAFREAR